MYWIDLDIQKKSNYLWNTLGSLMGAAMSVFMLMSVTQFLGAETAGIFSLAYANAQQFQVLGSFEMRTFQVTDSEDRYSFGDYLFARFLTCGLMLLLLVVYSVLSQGSAPMVFIFVAVGMTRFLDAFEDVFHGMFQKKGRLDIAGKALFERTFVTTASFSLGLFIFRDLFVATVISVSLSLVVIFIVDLFPALKMERVAPCADVKRAAKLLWECAPIFLGSFFAMYLANAPKYSLQAALGYEYQTYYSIIFMPAMVINLLCGFVFRPLLTDFAESWIHDLRRFRKLLLHAFKTSLFALMALLLLAAFLGVPVLSFLYGVDISPYGSEMLVLLLGGLFNAISVILYYALTTMRMQLGVLIGYGLSALYALFLGDWFLLNFGFAGAALLYDSTFLLLDILFFCFYGAGLHFKRGKKSC